MKILVLSTNQKSRYNVGHQLFKNEIAKQHNVRYYGPGHKFWAADRTDVRSIINVLQFEPDVIWSYMGKYCKWINGLEEVKIPKVHYVIDYASWCFGVEDEYIRRTGQDLVFAVCRHEVRSLKRNGHTCKIRWLPFSVDTNFFRYLSERKIVDIAAVFSTVKGTYPNRSKIIEILSGSALDHLSVVARASWPKTRLLGKDYVALLASSKISVNGVGNLKSLNWKFLEGPACGSLLLTEEADDMMEMGFLGGENCVVFNGMDDMMDKAMYYLQNNEERSMIAAKGYVLVNTAHSCAKRVEEMITIMRKELSLD